MISLPSCSNDHFLRTVPKKSLKSFIRYDLDPGHVSQDRLKNFNHYLSLEFNSFLKSSTPISNPFMSLSSHAIFKHIFFDFCGHSCCSLISPRTSPKKTLRISSDLILIIETHHNKSPSIHQVLR